MWPWYRLSGNNFDIIVLEQDEVIILQTKSKRNMIETRILWSIHSFVWNTAIEGVQYYDCLGFKKKNRSKS